MTIPKLLLVGAAGAFVLQRARSGTARRARRAAGTVPPPDPADPVQSLYSENDPAVELDAPAETSLDTVNETFADSGDLFDGNHASPTMGAVNPDEDVAMMEGANWLESLQADAVESGGAPGRELDMDDDADIERSPRSSGTIDVPLADRGSGGPAGA